MATVTNQNFTDTTNWGEITKVKFKNAKLYNEDKESFAVLYETLFSRHTRLFEGGREIYLLNLMKETAPKLCKTKALAERVWMKAWVVYGVLCMHLNSKNQIIIDKSISPGHRKLATTKKDLKTICPEVTNAEEWAAIFKLFDELAIIKSAHVYNAVKEKTEKCYLVNFLYHATKIDYTMDSIKPFWDYNRKWLKESIKKFLNDFYGYSIKERDIDDKMIRGYYYYALQPEDIAPMEESQAG